MEGWVSKHLKTASAVGDRSTHTITVKSDIYQIPLDVIFPDVLSMTDCLTNEINDDLIETSVEGRQDVKQSQGLKGLTCLTCGLVFNDRTEQQSHFSSDYHLFNLKRMLKKKTILSFEEYTDVVGHEKGGNSDMMDKESDDDDDDEHRGETGEESSEGPTDESSNEDENDMLNNMQSGDLSYRYEYADGSGRIRKCFQHNSIGPVFKVIRNHCLPWSFSFSLALFHSANRFSSREWNQNPCSDHETTLNSSVWYAMYKQLHYLRANPIMTILILRSGKFAGAVFDNRKWSPSNKQSALLVHKVIRRYTVRAKAGGGQSSHDSKGSKAKSMGAQLRRYGEKALKEDIQNILTLWQGYIQSSGLVLVATTKRMRNILFEKESSDGPSAIVLLKKDDPRIVNVPFVVDRPTLEAAALIRERALQVIVSSEDFGTAATEAERIEATALKPAYRKENNEEKITKKMTGKTADILDCSLSKELIAACDEVSDDLATSKAKSVLDKFSPDDGFSQTGIHEEEEDSGGHVLESFCDGWKLSLVINLPQSLNNLDTPLHLATTKNYLEMVSLLLHAGADPERMDARGRTPYHLSSSKEMRDIFRKARAELGESRWNWSKAGIPEPLTDEKIAHQKQKEKDKKKRSQLRKKEQKAKAEQEEKDRALAQKLQEELRLREQQEMELNLKNKAGECALCCKSLYKSDFFDVLDRKCCSTECVAKLRRKLAADAAMARFSK